MTAALVAAFPSAAGIVAAAEGAAERAWRPLDAFTPYPIPALDAPLAIGRSSLPWIMLAGGAATALALYGLQVWSATQAYPFNVGGRPLNAWPTFLIASVEFAILGAGIAGFIGLLVSAGLPRLHHPLFDRLAFERASQDQFVLALPLANADAGEVRAFLFDNGAVWVEEVEL